MHNWWGALLVAQHPTDLGQWRRHEMKIHFILHQVCCGTMNVCKLHFLHELQSQSYFEYFEACDSQVLRLNQTLAWIGGLGHERSQKTKG